MASAPEPHQQHISSASASDGAQLQASCTEMYISETLAPANVNISSPSIRLLDLCS